jgi:hypothetical protein
VTFGFVLAIAGLHPKRRFSGARFVTQARKDVLGQIGTEVRGTCSSLVPPLFLRRRTGLHSQPEGYGAASRPRQNCSSNAGTFGAAKKLWGHTRRGRHEGLSTPPDAARGHIMRTWGNRLCCFPMFILEPVPSSHRLRADSHTSAVTVRTNVTHHGVVGMTLPN